MSSSSKVGIDRRSFILATGAGALAAASGSAATVAPPKEGGALKKLGPMLANAEIRTCERMKGRKCCSSFIDDTIWVIRDLARQKPKSLFDNPFLKAQKRAHDLYGLKVQLNLFYRTDFFYGTDEFTLAEMPDTYKAEWQANKDWLRLSFHSLQEYPDYPFVNATYKDAKHVLDRTKGEVLRFAGEGVFSPIAVPHWAPISKEAVLALRDGGMKVIYSTHGPRFEYAGDRDALPYGHAFRLEQGRKPETALYSRGGRNKAIDSSVCAYNHLTDEQGKATLATYAVVYDRETKMNFKRFSIGPCLNLTPLDEIEKDFARALGREYIIYFNHEQYFYKDFFWYQPDYADKVLAAAKWLHGHGYEYIFMDEMLD